MVICHSQVVDFCIATRISQSRYRHAFPRVHAGNTVTNTELSRWRPAFVHGVEWMFCGCADGLPANVQLVHERPALKGFLPFFQAERSVGIFSAARQAFLPPPYPINAPPALPPLSPRHDHHVAGEARLARCKEICSRLAQAQHAADKVSLAEL